MNRLSIIFLNRVACASFRTARDPSGAIQDLLELKLEAPIPMPRTVAKALPEDLDVLAAVPTAGKGSVEIGYVIRGVIPRSNRVFVAILAPSFANSEDAECARQIMAYEARAMGRDYAMEIETVIIRAADGGTEKRLRNGAKPPPLPPLPAGDERAYEAFELSL
jgi:hypothetical protein